MSQYKPTVNVALNHDEIAEIIDAIEQGLSVAHVLFAMLPDHLIPENYYNERSMMQDILAKMSVAHDEIGCPSGDASPIPFTITEEGRGAL